MSQCHSDRVLCTVNGCVENGSHITSYVLYIFTTCGFQHLNVLTSIDERN